MKLYIGIEILEHTALSQYSMKKVLWVFGQSGANFFINNIQQLHSSKVIKPSKAIVMTHKDSKRELERLMFLKKKIFIKIKGCECVDGIKQIVYKSKEDMSSLSVSS